MQLKSKLFPLIAIFTLNALMTGCGKSVEFGELTFSGNDPDHQSSDPNDPTDEKGPGDLPRPAETHRPTEEIPPTQPGLPTGSTIPTQPNLPVAPPQPLPPGQANSWTFLKFCDSLMAADSSTEDLNTLYEKYCIQKKADH